jgi:hypothetical protein
MSFHYVSRKGDIRIAPGYLSLLVLIKHPYLIAFGNCIQNRFR